MNAFPLRKVALLIISIVCIQFSYGSSIINYQGIHLSDLQENVTVVSFTRSRLDAVYHQHVITSNPFKSFIIKNSQESGCTERTSQKFPPVKKSEFIQTILVKPNKLLNPKQELLNQSDSEIFQPKRVNPQGILSSRSVEAFIRNGILRI
jgi:hypothetical protein